MEKDTDLEKLKLLMHAMRSVDSALDHSEMESRGISPHRREEYQRQYEFLRYVLQVLDER